MFKKAHKFISAALGMAVAFSFLIASPANAATISITTIGGLTAPTVGGTPVSSITSTAQYTGSVTWQESANLNANISGTFQAGGQYQAKIKLTMLSTFTTGTSAPSSGCPIVFTAAGSSSINCNTDPFGDLYLTVSFAALPGGASHDASLDVGASKIKGVPIASANATTCLDGPTCASMSSNMIAVSLSSTQATDVSNSGSFVTSFVPTDSNATVNKVVKLSNFSLPYNTTLFGNATAFSGTSTVSNFDVFFVKVTAEDGTTVKYYGFKLTVASAPSGSSSSSSASEAAAAAAKAAAEQVAKAKATLVDSLKAGKPITANDLNSADISVASSAAADRVNAKIQALPAAQRADLATIKVLVQKENFVEKVSSSATQAQVNITDLVRVGLLPADYKNKSEVVRTLVGIDPASLTSIEKVEAAVKKAQAEIQARKDRLTATITRIQTRK